MRPRTQRLRCVACFAPRRNAATASRRHDKFWGGEARFIELYRKAGGRIDLHMLEGVGEGFISTDPTLTQAREAIEKIIDFVQRELG